MVALRVATRERTFASQPPRTDPLSGKIAGSFPAAPTSKCLQTHFWQNEPGIYLRLMPCKQQSEEADGPRQDHSGLVPARTSPTQILRSSDGKSISSGAVSPTSWRTGVFKVQGPNVMHNGESIGHAISAGMSSSGHRASTIATSLLTDLLGRIFSEHVARCSVGGRGARGLRRGRASGASDRGAERANRGKSVLTLLPDPSPAGLASWDTAFPTRLPRRRRARPAPMARST